MISDTLSDAVEDIDRYLAMDIYQGKEREDIIALRNRMDAVRAMLDAYPGDPPGGDHRG